MWGATTSALYSPFRATNFNPRSPCGERHAGRTWSRTSRANFNPRSPCGERPDGITTRTMSKPFQSTLPVWGATAGLARAGCEELISIHAPRVGSDLWGATTCARTCKFQSTLPVWGATFWLILVTNRPYFNPRSPCGERPLPTCQASAQSDFNPRSPCGERPQQIGSIVNLLPIYCDYRLEFAIAIYN